MAFIPSIQFLLCLLLYSLVLAGLWQVISCQNQTTTIEYQDIYLGLDAGLSAPKLDISFYPNPASDWCYFQTAMPIDYLEIMDASGRIVLRHENAALQGYFDISALPNGTYTIRIQARTGVAVKKLVKL